MLRMRYLVVLVLTWRSAVLALQLGLEEVQNISGCTSQVDVCNGSTRNLNALQYANSRCFCDVDCHLFGECCVDRAVRSDSPRSADSDGPTGHMQDGGLSQDNLNLPDVRGEIQETTEVLGVPRDRWGCQNFNITMKPVLPVKRVRMVVSCPADTSYEMLEKCEALNRSSSGFHYTMDIPVLSSASGIWYQNVYCAICNGDAGNLARHTYSLKCQDNYTREQVLSEGTYSTQPLEWILDGPGKNICRLEIKLQPDISPGFLRPCGKHQLLIENCPSDWTDHETTEKCNAYAFFCKDNINIFKNPHCALCNGVPPKNTTCWRQVISPRTVVPSFSVVMDFVAWEDDSQQYRSCRPPGAVWDILHETCMEVVTAADSSDGSNRKLNQTCPVIVLATSEFSILGNGSLQYTGENSRYVGYIFDDFGITDNKTAIVCALEQERITADLISGAYEGYLTGFCLSISVVCLILHVSIYYALPKLCNLPGKNLLSLSWALLFAQFVFLVGVNPVFEVPLEVCIGISVVEYFCFLAAFFWMNVMSVDIWRTFSGSTLRGSGGLTTHRKYALYAWGSSVLLALGALTVDLCTEEGAVKPSFGTGQVCWFGNQGGLALFLAMPLFILLMVNSGLFANTVYKIWQARRQGSRYIRGKRRDEVTQTSLLHPSNVKATANLGKEESSVTGRKDQIRFYLYLKLFVIMGLTWIFGFIAAFARVQFLWYPFIFFNGMQGAFIFVMFDMKRKIGYMLWDKYVSHRGYEPPGFLMVSSTNSATRTTGSNRSKCRESALASDKTDSLFATSSTTNTTRSNLKSTVT